MSRMIEVAREGRRKEQLQENLCRIHSNLLPCI